jgi:hypothetical protein
MRGMRGSSRIKRRLTTHTESGHELGAAAVPAKLGGHLVHENRLSGENRCAGIGETRVLKRLKEKNSLQGPAPWQAGRACARRPAAAACAGQQRRTLAGRETRCCPPQPA